MTIQVNRVQLERAARAASHCLEKKNTIPVLKTFHLTFGNELVLAASDLDHSVAISVDSSQGDGSSLCVDGRTLTSILSKLSDDYIEIETVNERLVIKRSGGDIVLRILDGDQFPDIPSGQSDVVSFPVEEMQEICRSVLLGSRDNVEDPRFSVVDISITRNLIEGRFRCLASDGHRLAQVSGLCNTEQTEPFKINLPIKAIRILTVMTRNGEGLVSFGQSANHVHCSIGRSQFAFRTSTAQFPNIQDFLDRRIYDHVVKVSAEGLAESLSLVGSVLGQRSEAVKFEFNGNLTISASDAELGEIEDVIDTGIDFEPFETGFNINYVLPIIQSLDGDIDLGFYKEVTQHKDKDGNVTSEAISWPMRVSKFHNNVTSSFDVMSLRM